MSEHLQGGEVQWLIRETKADNRAAVASKLPVVRTINRRAASKAVGVASKAVKAASKVAEAVVAAARVAAVAATAN